MDIPVPRGGVRGSSRFQQRLLSGVRGSADVPHGRDRGGYKVHARNVEQIVDSRGRLRPLLRTFQLVPWTSRFRGFFSTFLRRKKGAKIGPHSGSELSADFISSTPSACEKGHFSEDENFFEEDQKTWMRLPSGRWYLLRSEPEEYRDDPSVPG